MRRHLFLAFCAASMTMAMVGTGAEAAKPEPLALKTPAFIGSVGGDVMVKMRVEPDARSRELTIEWVAEDLSGGSHAITLEGARAAATHQFAIKRMSAGQHLVTATLRFSDGTEIRRTSTVTVIGAGGVGTPGIAERGPTSGNVRPNDRR